MCVCVCIGKDGNSCSHHWKLAVADGIGRPLGGQGRKGSIGSSSKLDVTGKLEAFGRPGKHRASEKSKQVGYSLTKQSGGSKNK